MDSDSRTAASVLRRLWDELGAKEQRWLSAELERDVLAVLSGRRYELSALIGPCSRGEAEDMLVALAEDGRFGQAYGACWAIQEAKDDAS